MTGRQLNLPYETVSENITKRTENKNLLSPESPISSRGHAALKEEGSVTLEGFVNRWERKSEERTDGESG